MYVHACVCVCVFWRRRQNLMGCVVRKRLKHAKVYNTHKHTYTHPLCTCAYLKHTSLTHNLHWQHWRNVNQLRVFCETLFKPRSSDEWVSVYVFVKCFVRFGQEDVVVVFMYDWYLTVFLLDTYVCVCTYVCALMNVIGKKSK